MNNHFVRADFGRTSHTKSVSAHATSLRLTEFSKIFNERSRPKQKNVIGLYANAVDIGHHGTGNIFMTTRRASGDDSAGTVTSRPLPWIE